VDNLTSDSGKKTVRDQVIKRSMELYGYTPEEKSDENAEWMRRNGYFGKRRYKWGIRGRRLKSEI
jgi:hypothetical protein